MTLDGIFTEGYKKLIGDLKDDQAKYLRVIAEARGMPVEWIEKAEGIFIPNNDFMYFLFGQGILQFDCYRNCLLYTSPSPRDGLLSRMPSSA